MKSILLILLLSLIFTTSHAEIQSSIDRKAKIINNLKHINVFLSQTVKNIQKTEKQPVEFRVLNFGISRCTLEGHVWQENTKVFQALLVETQQFNCGKKKYPAHFYSRIISDERLFLDSDSKFGSYAKTGMEIFLVRSK